MEGSGIHAGKLGRVLLSAVKHYRPLKNVSPAKKKAALAAASMLVGTGGMLLHHKAVKGIVGKKHTEMFHQHAHNALKSLVAKHHPELKSHKLGKTHNKKVSIHEVFGKNATRYGSRILNALEVKSGGKLNAKKLLGKVGKVAKKSIAKLKDFANGKTKFKPSDLAKLGATAVTIAGAASAAIPGVDLISVPAASATATALGATASQLKSMGRGTELPGSGVNFNTGRGSRLHGSGIELAGSGVNLAGQRKSKCACKGKGTKLAGSGGRKKKKSLHGL